MIDINIQFKLIIFSLIYGFSFSIILDFFNINISKFKTKLKILSSFALILFMTIFYFIGIKKIGNSIFHIYSILFIIVGFILHNLIIKLIANSSKK